MTNRIQDKLLEIGRYGCYFLCLLKVAECEGRRVEDIVSLYDAFTLDGLMKRNCFVVNPKGILERLLHKHAVYKYVDGDYKDDDYDYVIKRFVLRNDGSELTHFVLYTDGGAAEFDPAPDSKVKACGIVKDCRCFSFIK